MTKMAKRKKSAPCAELTIHHFSCIAELTVRFSRLTVLIGEQASGKSITSKLYYFFTEGLFQTLFDCIQRNEDWESFETRYAEMFRAIFPETTWRNDSFRITWSLGKIHILLTHRLRANALRIETEGIKESYQTFKKGKRRNQDKSYSRVAHALLPTPRVDFIPAGRSFFSTIQDSVFTLLSRDIGIDYFLKTFGERLESIRFMLRRRNETLPTGNLNEKVLHGRYEDDGRDRWIVQDAKHRVRLADASSGQQEALPLLQILGAFPRFNAENATLVIEEPEAHLYPTAQRAIIDFLGDLLARANGNGGCILTTHSPFILCCLNNLITRGELKPTDVTAYHLHDGGADNILNAEVGLIDAVRFDDISTSIANDE